MTNPAASEPGPGPDLPVEWRALLEAVERELRELAAHPARSVVLLPYAQLRPLAARLWARRFPDSFAPRFETTLSWAEHEAVFEPGEYDLSFDRGRDWLTALSLLEGNGLGADSELLAGPLLELALPLAQVAASQPPALRPTWMEHARSVLPVIVDGPLALDARLAQIALVWAGSSDYSTDVLFSQRVGRGLDALLRVPGLQIDLLGDTLAEHYFEKAAALSLDAPGLQASVTEHACSDGEDEAERAAACVLRHVQAGRTPVALVAGDRLLTRRIGALLDAQGLRPGHELRDETGWRLSTTQAAAAVMGTLQACVPQVSSEAVLDWIKLLPAADPAEVAALEQRLRRHAVRSWGQALRLGSSMALVRQLQAWRQGMAAARPVTRWLPALRQLLQDTGLWQALRSDLAGSAVIEALGLDEAEQGRWEQLPSAGRRMGLGEFTRWVRHSLEAAHYRPAHPGQARVVVLPLAQLAGRPFAAAVVPGVDEQRLPAVPEPPGPWSEAQRQALYLPTREQLRQAQDAAWARLLGLSRVDVLWRRSDADAQPLQASPLLQAWRLQHPERLQPATDDPRTLRPVPLQPISRPAPDGSMLPILPLSASAYERLRNCPYQFFALRQLGLQDDADLDADLDKRAWGTWLHAVLRHFHEALQQEPEADRLALMAGAAELATAAQGLDADSGEFLPFAADWPRLRDAYLLWLQQHEGAGAVFEQAEWKLERSLDGLQLRGSIDRVDRLPDGTRLLIDYKTESQDRSRKRIKAGTEETQLPFYALLAGGAPVRASYLNLSEREQPQAFELPGLQQLATLLAAGMQEDVQRIAGGAPLPALGEGSVCDWCEARGLCRKDFWSE